jgi:hypothetical protein
MPTYDFNNNGISILFNDYQNGNAPSNMISDIQSDLRQFIKDNFNINQDQSDYLDEIPNQVFTNIGNNIAHALNNNYSISIQINEFSNGFFDGTGSALFTPPTWGTSRIECKIGHWTTHDQHCHLEEHYGLRCSINF